jgi:hypothetical protein
MSIYALRSKPGENISWIPEFEVKRRVDTIPIPNKLKTKFIQLVYRWNEHSGSEWTVSRLKSFKDYLMQSYALGSHQNEYKPQWFATTSSGNLSGVIGALTRIALLGVQHFEAVLNLVHVYSGATRTELSHQQFTEISSEIQQSPVVVPKRGHGNKVGLTDVDKAFRILKPGIRRKCKLAQPLSLNLPGKQSQGEKLAEDVLTLSGSPIYQDFHRAMVLNAALGCENRLHEVHGFLPHAQLTKVGNVHFTYEPGLKVRYFAAPNLIVQRALEPLKDMWLDALRKFPWDCTLDQRMADTEISSALEAGKTVHSVDMSKATDNFPWEFQLRVAQHLVNIRDVSGQLLDLFKFAVSESEWLMGGKPSVRWTKGQPLGLGPSFPLFTISHGVLLYILNEYKWNRSFYVLGDDVIILDDELHSKYREVLKAWQIQVSEAKSFSSKFLAQFAGVTYTNKGRFWIPKWRPFTRTNLLDLAAWWYPGLTKGLPDHSLIERVLALPEPYGRGYNPKGIPLDERLDPFMVEALVERERLAQEAVLVSCTKVDLGSLRPILEKSKWIPDWKLADIMLAIQSGADDVNKSVQCGKYRASTETPLPASLTMLMHGTETPGYPRMRRKASKVDPYTLGTLRSWKRLLKRVDEAKASLSHNSPSNEGE